jgi:uncharacterized tellurite resistance protein B-like protein
MASEDLILTLAKVLVAAAWADGELTHVEVNSMKDVLSRLPHLNARQYALVDMYVDSPVDAAERARLVDELRNQIASPENKDLVLQALDDLILADGHVSAEERQVAEEIKAAVAAVDLSALGKLSRLISGIGSMPSQGGGPNREVYFDDFMRNRVYYAVRRRLERGEGALDIPEPMLRRLSLAGGMMAKVATANPQVTDHEVATMVKILEERWDLSRDQATFVAEVAIDQRTAEMDYFRLADEFASAATFEERVAFIHVLFAVAGADGQTTDDEIEEIRRLSRAMKVPHRQFIEAKLQSARGQSTPAD